MTPLLSIIVTVYNFEKYLNQCLDSVIKQVPHSGQVEVVVVDDGSIDQTPKLLSNYQQYPFIQIIRTQNQGVSEARNTGLQYAKGTYLTFLDGDDYWDNGFKWGTLEKILETGADIAEFAFRKVDNRGHTLGLTDHKENCLHALFELTPEKVLARVKQFNWYLWCRIYKAELFKGVLFPIGKTYEDVRILPQIYQKAKTCYTSTLSLVCYRANPDSITHTAKLQHVFDLLEHANWYAERAQSKSDIDALMARGIYGSATRMSSRLGCDDYKILMESQKDSFEQMRIPLSKLICLSDFRFMRYFLFPYAMIQNLRRIKGRRMQQRLAR